MEKETVLDNLLTRREAEQMLGVSTANFQKTYLAAERIKPVKESGHSTGKIQLFWKNDVLELLDGIDPDSTHRVFSLDQVDHALKAATDLLFMKIPYSSYHIITQKKLSNKQDIFKLDIKDWAGDTIDKATVTVTHANDTRNGGGPQKVEVVWNEEVKKIKQIFEKHRNLKAIMTAFEKEGIDWGYWENDFYE